VRGVEEYSAGFERLFMIFASRRLNRTTAPVFASYTVAR